MKATRKKDLSPTARTELPCHSTATAECGEARASSAGLELESADPAPRPVSPDPPALPLPDLPGFLAQLRGLGLLSTQLNDYRLYLPVDLRRRLNHLIERPWVVSFWCEGCLRVVPQHLWADYVEQLRQEAQRLGAPDLVDEVVVQPASAIQLEHGGRWHLPHSLADLGKIDGSALCLLCPSDGGLEIWEASVKQERLRAIVGKLDHRLVAVTRAARFSALELHGLGPQHGSPVPRPALHDAGSTP